MTPRILTVLSSPLKNASEALLKEYSQDIKFDVVYLSSEPKEKILKKDVDLDFSIFDNYDIVCPIGADSLKHVCGLTGITKYNGNVVKEKFIPILDPNTVFVKPQYADEIVKAFNRIKSIFKGDQPIFNKNFHLLQIHPAEDFLNITITFL